MVTITSQTEDSNPNISGIAFNIKGLNRTIRRQRFSDQIKKQPSNTSKCHSWNMRTQKSQKKKDEQNVLSTH